MARYIPVESIDGKKQWRARVSVAHPFTLPYVELQRRNVFRRWETWNAMMPCPPEGEQASVEELVEWAIETLVERAKRGLQFTNDLNSFVYGGDGK
jgi:hypothetical protein